MAILGVDVSHYQGSPNFAQVKASGRSFAILKATESTNYVDPTLTANRKAAHAAGLIVGLYHFARAGDAATEARWFLSKIGTLQAGEFLVLDWEVPGANPPAWCKTWLDTVYAATGVRPLIYMNQSAVNGSNWSAIAADYGLWLAKYDQATSQPSVAHWGGPAMKQFYDKGVVPGIAGACDVNVFFGSPEQLLAYGKGGSPTPTVQEDDVRLIRTPDGTIWKLTEFSMEAEGSLATVNALAKAHGVPVVAMEYAEKDPVFLDAYARRNRLIADTAAAVGKAQAPVIDEAKLAAALLSSPDAVQALGKAIADNLQLSPRTA